MPLTLDLPARLAPAPAASHRHSSALIGMIDMSRKLVHLENITKTYQVGDMEVPVLKGVSLTIRRGEMVALMGASGSGKTTLMNILGCLDRPSSGEFWLNGQDMSGLTPDQRAVVRTSQLGFVFQNFNLLARTSALQNVLMPLDYAVPRTPRGGATGLAMSLLKQVGLADRMHHESSQMSGGQQQRVAIARALINRPALLLADEPTGNLDSRSGDEILRMFQRLHAEGITVILVTHDPKVAGYADRTIRMADGLIEEDQRGPAGKGASIWTGCELALRDAGSVPLRSHAPASHPADVGGNVAWTVTGGCDAPPQMISTFHPSPARVVVQENHCAATTERPRARPLSVVANFLVPPTLRTALGNLQRQKMRSALTVLGVIIGVAAVIAMREIGQGSKNAIDKTIASMGALKIPIFPAAVNTGGVNQGAGTYQTLKPGDVDEIARQCPAVTVIAPLVWAQAQVVYGTRNWVPQRMTGTTPDYLATRDWQNLAEGECFTDSDVRLRTAVCLIGATVKQELFADESPIGKTIRIRNVPFQVVGLLGRRGSDMMGHDQDDCIIAPWTTVKFRVNGSGAGSTKAAASGSTGGGSTHNPYTAATRLYPQASHSQLVNRPQPTGQMNIDMIQAKAATPEQVPVAIAQIAALLRERHHLAEGADDDFKILDMTEIARASSRTSELMGTLLLVVAAISLAVGGVGIMNIMLVSVTERTREIGLRMAVGARRHHILQQFLLEAFLLCLAGGAVGILVGRGTSILVREIQHWTTEISLPAIAISVLVAAGVGIVFGFYPAWKASRLDPIEALRHE